MDTVLAWIDAHPWIGTIVAGTLALFGVILALCGNALLQWWDRRSKRRHDRDVIRSALLAELAHLHVSYEYRVGLMEKAKDSFDVPVHTATEVYDRVLDRVGLFTAQEASAVIHAYLAAKHLPMNLRRLSLLRDLVGGDIGSDRDFVRVTAHDMDQAIRLHRERIDLFKVAMIALRGTRPPHL